MAALLSGHRCPDCHGTGADAAKTAAMKAKESSATGYVRCWTCNGNGLDPAAYFNWTKPANTETS